MPVRFKATSEYQSHFTPIQSNTISPHIHTMEEKGPAAGVTSEKLSIDNRISLDCEPALQRKKRTPVPVTSLSSDFYSSSYAPGPADEYILLGNNEKFVENIRYRNRNINNCKNVGEFNFNRDVSPPKIQKTKSQKENNISDPPPAPVVDTTLFRKATETPSTPLAPRQPKQTWAPAKTTEEKTIQEPPRKKVTTKTDNRDELRKNITRVLQKEKQAATKTQPAVKRPTNPRMRTYVKPWVMSQARHDQKEINTAAVPKLKVKQLRDQVTVNKEKSILQPEQTTGKEKMKAPVEKPTKEQITQEPEHNSKDSNYGLKYKAGVSRVKRQGPTRLSEYQREFEWKNAVKSSPLMDAEQMIYKSSVNAASVKPDIIPKMTEYNAQFKEYPFVPVHDDLLTPQPGSARPKGSAKVKRSKSTGALDNVQRDGEKVTSPEPQQTLGEELKTKHGKYRKRVKSEYAVNFQAPWQYEYVDGAWKKASPPHIQQLVDEVEPVSVPAEPTASWFQEVMELRQKALEYRKRAQGTHFSREHLVQLMARQAELWDQMSEGSRTLSALSLEAHASHSQRPIQVADTEYGDEEDMESGVISPESRSQEKSVVQNGKVEARTYTKKQSLKKLAKKLEYSSGENGTVLDKNELDEESDDPDVESEEITPKERHTTKGRKPTPKTRSTKSAKSKKGRKKESSPSKGVKSAWTTEKKESTRESSPEEDEGRIPTPTLRQQAANQHVKRHHLDRTTPSVGGALLTSPPRQRKIHTSPPIYGSGYQSCDEDSDSGTLENEPAVPRPVFNKSQTPVKKTFNFSNVNASPTFGLPSYDSHFLRDDSASSDRPLNTKYVDSPQKLTSASDSHDATDGSDDSRALPPSNQGRLGVTYNRADQSNNSREPKPFSWSLDGGMFVPRRTYSDDDDDLSTSVRSIASSSSLASEVLERAQRRNKDFWGRGASQRR